MTTDLSLFALGDDDRQAATPGALLLRLEVPGPAVGAARPRVVRLPNGASHTFIPDKSVKWEERCRQIAVVSWGDEPLDEPVRLVVRVLASRPKRLRRRADPRSEMHAACKPDLDNVCKLVMDALTLARVWTDDTRVAELVASRRYLPITDAGEDIGGERVEIEVRRA